MPQRQAGIQDIERYGFQKSQAPQYPSKYQSGLD
jgi:hypothetical protein